MRYFITISCCIALLVLMLNVFDYFDPMTLCYIRINRELVGGRRDTIKQAIRLLKKTDKPSYHTLCAHVSRIRERMCIGSDWHLENPPRGFNAHGCYIRGTKTIYLKPRLDEGNAVVTQRMQTIRTYAQLSAEFENGQ